MAQSEVQLDRRRQNFKKGFNRLVRGATGAIQTFSFVIPMMDALPTPQFSADTGNTQGQHEQALKTPQVAKVKHPNRKSEFTYNRNQSNTALNAQDKKTGIHSPPSVDTHMGGDMQSPQFTNIQTATQGNTALSLPGGVQLAGIHGQALARNAQKKMETERQTALENEINSIRLLDKIAQSIGLDTAPVTEALLATVGMTGADNAQIIADAKSYLTDTLQKEGPRAFAEMPQAQLVDMANQLKWNSWSESFTELKSVPQRALHEAKALGDQLSTLLKDGSPLDGIADLFKAVGDTFNKMPAEQKAGLITLLTLYGSGAVLIEEGIRTKDNKKTVLGLMPFVLACMVNQVALTPTVAVGAPTDFPASPSAEPSLTPAPSVTPTIELTPVQNLPSQTSIDVSIQADQQAIIDQGQGGYTYVYNAQTKALTPPQNISMDTGGRSEFVVTANTQRAEIQTRVSENPEYTSVHTNADETQNVATSFNNVGGKWTIFWPEAVVGNQTFLSSSPSDWRFNVEVKDTKSQVKYAQIALPEGALPEDVVVKFVGDNQIVEVTDKTGAVWAMDWRHGEWVSLMDIPSKTLLNTSVLSNYLKAIYPDNTAAQNDSLLKRLTETRTLTQQDASGATYRVIKDVNGISLFVKYQTPEGRWGEWQQSLETQKASIDTTELFVNTLNSAGISINTKQLLEQGFQMRTITDTNGKSFEVAYFHIDPDPNNLGELMEGEYPMMIKSEEGDWEKATFKNNPFGIIFGYTDRIDPKSRGIGKQPAAALFGENIQPSNQLSPIRNLKKTSEYNGEVASQPSFFVNGAVDTQGLGQFVSTATTTFKGLEFDGWGMTGLPKNNPDMHVLVVSGQNTMNEEYFDALKGGDPALMEEVFVWYIANTTRTAMDKGVTIFAFNELIRGDNYWKEAMPSKSQEQIVELAIQTVRLVVGDDINYKFMLNDGASDANGVQLNTVLQVIDGLGKRGIVSPGELVIGMQYHNNENYDAIHLRNAVEQLYAVGIRDIRLTEVDIMSKTQPSQEQILKYYQDMINAVKEEKKLHPDLDISVIFFDEKWDNSYLGENKRITDLQGGLYRLLAELYAE